MESYVSFFKFFKLFSTKLLLYVGIWPINVVIVSSGLFDWYLFRILSAKASPNCGKIMRCTKFTVKYTISKM